MFKLSWKGVMANKVRLMLTAVAIVLGVAFVSGSYVFTDSLKAAFDVLFTQEGQENDLVVRAKTEFDFSFELGTVPEELLPEIEQIPGVERAVPLIQSIAQLVSPDGKPLGGNGPPTLGFSWVEGAEEVSALELREGRAPAAPDEVVIDRFTADANGFGLGDEIDVILYTGVERFRISGIVSFGDADNLLGATIAAFEMETAQRIFDLEGRFNQISVIVAEGTEVAAVRASIEGIVPDGVEVITGDVEIEEGREAVDQGVGFFNTALLVFAGIAIFVGAFIIQNTYRIIVAQRTRELAMLRAVGATGRQVTRMVIVEAVIVALIASAIGIGAGILLALLLKTIFGALGFGFPEGPLTINPRTIVIGMTVGLVVTVGSALLPARKASKVAPIAALREVESTYFKSLRLRALAGSGVLLLGLLMVLAGLFTEVSNALAITGIGAAVVFLGVSVLAPLFARVFGRYAGAPLPPLLGVTGRLAQENAIRKPRRMASTASALMIGVALVTVIATLAASLKGGIQDALAEEVVADFQVETTSFGDPTATGVTPEVTERLRALPEVGVVSSFRIGAWRDPGTLEEDLLIGVDADLDQVTRLKIESGSFDDLRPGTVLLFADYAADRGLAVGDPFPIEFPDGVKDEPEVAAIFAAELFGTNVMIPMEVYEERYTNRFARMAMLNVADGLDPVEARPEIEAVVAEYPNLEMNDADEYVAKVSGQIDTILNILTALLAMAVLIALLGIANTLALSIMERRREIGLLRAVGMVRPQVRRMIRWEAVLIAVFGASIGIVVGIGLGVAVVAAIGQGLSLTLPWADLLTYLLAAILGGIVASILPARRGARLDVLEAIAYE
jgi:putative ABC transport system permease protein